LNLTSEFEEIETSIGVRAFPLEKWRPLTLRMYEAAKDLNLDPYPTPKAVDIKKCVSCGLCELGCVRSAKWDARKFLDESIKKDVNIATKTKVVRLIIKDNRVIGIEAKSGNKQVRFYSDVVVLAAGGIGTAQILKNSSIETSNTLWVDIVATLGGVYKDAQQIKELPMVWYTKREDYMISPYIDVLSLWFHKPWRDVSVKDRVGLMVKLADSANGIVSKDGRITKELTERDIDKIEEGLELASQVMKKAGVTGMLNGGHLGGTVPLTKKDISSMRPSYLPENLWIADLSLIPTSQGMPTILLTSALALKVTRKIIETN
jgi:ferredoxin